MKNLTFLAAFAALGLALSAPSALAQDSQGCSKTNCVWGWGPEPIGELCNFGLFGPFDSTSKVKIMYGIRDCTTTTYDKVCCEVDDFVLVFKKLILPSPVPPFFTVHCIPVNIFVGTHTIYKKQNVTTTVVSIPTIVPLICPSVSVDQEDIDQTVLVATPTPLGALSGSGSPSGPISGPINPSPAPITIGNHFALTHESPEAIDFDGVPFVTGTKIKLWTLDPGLHTLTYYQSGFSSPVMQTLTLNVTQSYPAWQEDSDPATSVVPTGEFAFRNDTQETLEVVLEATPLVASVTADIYNNHVTVAPGETITRTVEFFTTTDHILGDGIPASARIDVHLGLIGPDPIASATIKVGSHAAVRGTREDFQITSTVGNDTLPRLVAKAGLVGDLLTVDFTSPQGTFDGAPIGVYVDTFDPTLGVLRALPTVPEFHMSANGMLIAPYAPLPTNGLTLQSPLSPQIQGEAFRIQGVTLSPNAANGMYAITDAHDILVL